MTRAAILCSVFRWGFVDGEYTRCLFIAITRFLWDDLQGQQEGVLDPAQIKGWVCVFERDAFAGEGLKGLRVRILHIASFPRFTYTTQTEIQVIITESLS